MGRRRWGEKNRPLTSERHTGEVVSPWAPAMREFLRSLVIRAVEQPVQFIVKPAIKSAVVIGLLTVAAGTLYERSFDRQGLGKLAGASAKPLSKHAASKR